MPPFKLLGLLIKNNSISKGGEKMSDQKLDLILNKLQSLEYEMKSMNNELISMNSRIENLETKTDHIQSDVTVIKGNIERIDHAVNKDIVTILKMMVNKQMITTQTS